MRAPQRRRRIRAAVQRRTYPDPGRALRQVHRTRAAHATYLRRRYADFRPRYVLGMHSSGLAASLHAAAETLHRSMLSAAELGTITRRTE